jgi:hypothetical protein
MMQGSTHRYSYGQNGKKQSCVPERRAKGMQKTGKKQRSANSDRPGCILSITELSIVSL